MALSIAALSMMLFGSFLFPQMEFYYDHNRRSQAMAMCSEAYIKMEKILRYGYLYACDPEQPEELFYFIRAEETEEGRVPPYRTWPCLSVEDLEISSFGDMSLELNFDGTTDGEVKVKMEAVRDNRVIYEEEAHIRSLYWYNE